MPLLTIPTYKAKPGHESALEALVRRHVPMLREHGFLTDADNHLAQTADGTWIEVFEWKNEQLKDDAHQHPAVRELWGAMMEIAEFPPLASMEACRGPFVSFPAVG